MVPETRYARSGNLHIAYQLTGNGPVDLLFVHGWISHIEHLWEEPSLARFLNRLASFSRLILLDKRGTGLSDPVPLDKLPTLEERMDDMRAVMDAAGSERAALLGTSEAGALNSRGLSLLRNVAFRQWGVRSHLREVTSQEQSICVKQFTQASATPFR
jgi:pimeloyl-ACP methyl ester carboxylesterase